MRKHVCAATALGLFALLATSAKAETFSFTLTTSYGVEAAGTLTGVVDPTVAGAFDITGADGQVNNVPLTLYTPSGTAVAPQTATFAGTAHGGYTYDNVIYTTGDSLDSFGLLFSDNGDHTSFFQSGGSYFFTNDESTGSYGTDPFVITDTTPVTGTPSSVTPEPSSIALLGTGLLGLGGVLRKRFTA